MFETLWRWEKDSVEEVHLTFTFEGSTQLLMLEVVGYGEHEGGRLRRIDRCFSEDPDEPHMLSVFAWEGLRCVRVDHVGTRISNDARRTFVAEYDGARLVRLCRADADGNAHWERWPTDEERDFDMGDTLVRFDALFRCRGKQAINGIAHTLRATPAGRALFTQGSAPNITPGELRAFLEGSGELQAAAGSSVWEVGAWRLHDERADRFDACLTWLAGAAPLPHVGALVVGSAHPNLRDIGQRLGDLGPLWRTFPELRELVLRGDVERFGVVDASHLETLDLLVRTTTKDALADLAEAELPSVRALSLAFESTAAERQDPSLLDFAVLANDNGYWPCLAHVSFSMDDASGLYDGAAKDQILRALLSHPTVVSLDLASSSLTAESVSRLLSTPGFERLSVLQIGAAVVEPAAIELIANERDRFAHLHRTSIYGGLVGAKALASLWPGFESRTRAWTPFDLGLGPRTRIGAGLVR